MFKKNKIALAVILSASTLTWGVANAAVAPVPDYNGAVVADEDTVSEVQPKFVFEYDPAMSGVLIDITEGLNASDEAVAAVADVTKCGDNVAYEYAKLSDMNCSSAGCEWLPPVALVDQHSYYIVAQKVLGDGTVTMSTRDDCKTGNTNAGVVFSVDTTAGTTTTTPPTAPPAQVVITPQTTACDGGTANDPCVIEFKHDNAPAASHYRVWINDKNGIQIDEDELSAKADQSTDINGWFEVDGSGTAVTANTNTAAVFCVVNLTGTRTCTLEISGAHPVHNAMKAGSKLRVWVRAWNAAGYADWSDSVEIEVTP